MTRNEFIDALEEEKKYIELDGELNEAILSELNKQIKENRSLYKVFNFSEKVGVVGVAACIISMFTGVGEIVLADVVGCALFTGFSAIMKGGSSTEFKQYEVIIAHIKGKDIVSFLHKDFNKQYDTIKKMEQYTFLNKIPSRCPNCNRKWGEGHKKYNPIECQECKKEYLICYDVFKMKKARIK